MTRSHATGRVAPAYDGVGSDRLQRPIYSLRRAVWEPVHARRRHDRQTEMVAESAIPLVRSKSSVNDQVYFGGLRNFCTGGILVAQKCTSLHET